MKKTTLITATIMATTLITVAAPAFAASQTPPTSQGVKCVGTTKTVVEIVQNGKVTYYNAPFPNGFTAPVVPSVWTVKVNNISFKTTILTEKPGQLWLSIPTVTRILNVFGDHATFNGKTITAKSLLHKLINQPVGVEGTYPNAMVNGEIASYGMATKTYQHQVFINLYSAIEPILSDCNVYEVPNMTTKTFTAHLPHPNGYTGFYTSTGQPILSK